MNKHIGRVRVTHQVILEWLDFEGGNIKWAVQDGVYPDLLITIEHPGMPEVEDGSEIPEVTPAYNFISVSVGRIDPPKSVLQKSKFALEEEK